MTICTRLLPLVFLFFSSILCAQDATLVDSLFTDLEKNIELKKWPESVTTGKHLGLLLEGTKDYERLVLFHQLMASAEEKVGNIEGFTHNIDTAIAIIYTQFDSIHPLIYQLWTKRVQATAFFDFTASELLREQFKDYIDTHPNEQGYANYLRTTGISKAMQGQFYTAIDYYEESFQVGGFYSSSEEAGAYHNIAYFYSQTRQKKKSFSYEIKSLEVIEKQEIPDYSVLSFIYNHLGVSNIDPKETKVELLNRIGHLEKSKKYGELANDPSLVLAALLNEVRLYLKLSLLSSEDTTYIQKALQLCDSIENRQRVALEAGTRMPNNFKQRSDAYLMDFYWKLRNKTKFKEHLNQFLSEEGKSYNKLKSPGLLEERRAYLNILEDKPFLALAQMQSVFRIILPQWDNNNDYYENPPFQSFLDDEEKGGVLMTKVRAFLLAYQQKKDTKDLNGAKESFGLWYKLTKHSGLLNGWISSSRDEYQVYTEAGYEIFNHYAQLRNNESDLLNALFYAEHQKNYSFLDKIGDQNAYLQTGIPDTVKLKKGLLNEALGHLKSQRDAKITAKDTTAALAIREHDAKQKEYFDYLEFIQKEYPTDSIFNKALTAFDATKMASYIANVKHESIIEYVIGADQIHAIILDESGNKMITFEGTKADILDLVKSYRIKLTDKGADYSNEAKEIYRRLFLPLLPYISSVNLVIVPDKELVYLPFDLLMDKNGRFVIEDYAIRYVYSLLWEQYEKERPRRGNNGQILAMAASPEMNSYAALYRDATRDDLGHLPGALEEVKRLSRMLEGEGVLEDNATESFFKKTAHNYAVLHLATHAIINEERPSESQLVFVQENIDNQDAHLNAYEISQMQLSADLVTLSACNSGYGSIFNGEGVQSLAAAFVYAGCPNSVSSLWTVHDKSSVDIMASFYENLMEGMPKHKALRAAKLAFLHSQPDAKKHPYYWGGFVYYGDDQPIVLAAKQANYTWTWGILAMLLGLAVFMWKRKRAFEIN